MRCMVVSMSDRIHWRIGNQRMRCMVVSMSDRIHWRIRGGARGTRPLSIQFLLFSWSFWWKSCQIIRFCPSLKGSPVWESLNLPLDSVIFPSNGSHGYEIVPQNKQIVKTWVIYNDLLIELNTVFLWESKRYYAEGSSGGAERKTIPQKIVVKKE